MPLWHPGWILEYYIDLALQLGGSAFTVGVVEEKCNIFTVSAMLESSAIIVAKPVIMATMLESPVVLAATPCKNL